MDDHLQTVSHDRDYSKNNDEHEQAMLSMRTDNRPSEKHTCGKKNAGTLSIRDSAGLVYIYIFFMIDRAPHYSIQPGHSQ